MWLLDHNIPKQVLSVIESFSVSCDTARNRSWDTLRNGELVAVAVAVQSGFTCILTRDVDFAKDATSSLKQFNQLAVVLVGLKPGALYAKSFEEAWKIEPIVPVPGSVITWPSK